MPSVIKFLGCSVETFTSQMAWGNSPATLSVTLVPDLRDSDEFVYENNGRNGIYDVYTFTAGSFRFRGFIKNWVKKRDSRNNPIYEVTLSDAREVLSGTKIIISRSYSQSSVVPNVINAFGYCEALLGFGNSQSNDGGMPWRLIINSIIDIVNENVAPVYGGRLRWGSSYFTVDLSRIPVPPLFYKLQGNPSLSLLECIDQVCNDCARDWYCEVTEDNVITVKTISRRAQLAYNRKSVTQYANSISQAKSIESGWEANDSRPTSKLLFGANVSQLYHANSSSLYPYWGTDINGNHLYSNDLDDSTVVSINCSTCYDVIGSYTYSTTVGEIRIAMYGEQAWLNYISIKKPDLALRLGVPVFYTDKSIQDLLNGNFSQAGPATLLANLNKDMSLFLNSSITGQNTSYEKIKRVHQLIQEAGQNYMGRSYIVNLPFILTGFDIETQEIQYSYSVDSEGGYVAYGEDLLGMDDTSRLWAEQSPGKIGCFATYDNDNVDAQQVTNINTKVQLGGIYVKAGVETEIKQLPFPCVIIHLSNPLYEKKQTVYMAPVIDWISVILNGLGETQIKSMLGNNMGVLPVGVGIVSRPKIPNYISIPLRSKLETYGGSAVGRGNWYLAGYPGNTEVEQDESLNPWTYGGYPGMFLAATTKLFQVNSQNYAIEFGGLSFPGLPSHSLGDELYYQGSNITSINVSVGDGGFVTNYSLRAFDPNVMGFMAKREEARFQRIAKTLARQRKELKDTYDRIFNNVGIMNNFSIQNYAIHPTLAPRTPHTVLAARNWNFSDDAAYHETAALTPTEAIANVDTRSATSFKNFSMMSLNGIFRPFTTKPSRTDMPAYITLPSSIESSRSIYTSFSMNPFKPSNDIFIYSKGDTMTEDVKTLNYDGETNLLKYDNQGSYEDVRGIGVKGPLTYVSYGFNIYCKSVVTGDGTIEDEDRKKSQIWKAGQMDPIFDTVRGTWTSHDTVYGKLVADIAAKSSSSWQSGGIRLLGRDDIDLSTVIPVYNIHNQPIASGIAVTATYDAHANSFIIQSADC